MYPRIKNFPITLSPCLGFIIILIISCIQIAQGQQGQIGDNQKIGNIIPFIYKRFEAKGNLNYPLSEKVREIVIQSGAGHITLTNHEKPEIEIEAKIRTTSLSRRKSQKFLQEFLKFSLTEKENKIYIHSKFNIQRKKKKSVEGDRYVYTFSMGAAMGTPGSKIHLNIKVPPGIHLRLIDHSGAIRVQDIANSLQIEDKSGNISLENIRGKVRIQDGSGRINCQNLLDSVRISDGSGNIEITGVKGTLNLEDRSGNLWIRDVEGDLSLDDTSGHMDIHHVSNSIHINDKSGKILLNDISYQTKEEGELVIQDRSGAISLQQIHGKLQLSDRSGKVYRR